MQAHVKHQRTVENKLPSQMLALEPRYLFDAAVVTTVADVTSDPAAAPLTATAADPGPALTAGAASDSLYGVSLNGYYSSSPGSSSLYVIDETTGAGTLIGDIGYAVNSIAFDPTTGLMYGSTTSWSGAFNGLLQIDPSTGAGTEIGAGFGSGFTSILGLSFNSAGDLFGWHDPSADDPVMINKATGVATTIGNAGISTGGQVMAFDNSDALILVQSSSQYNIDLSTGAAVFTQSLGFDPGSGGADINNTTGELWAARDNGRVLDSFIRVTDLGANTSTDINTDVQYLNALAFGGTGEPAVINDQGFSINENLDVDDFAGQIKDSDGGIPAGVTFTLINGQDSDAFAVSTSGEITVKDNTKLDYENDLLPPLPTIDVGGHAVPYLTFQVEADDGVAPATIDIFMLLRDVNDAPEAAMPGNTSIALGQTATVQISATDEDVNGDSNTDQPAWSVITYELDTPPAGAAIDANGLFTWTPTVAGTTTVTVKVSNSFSGALEQVVQFDVTVEPTINISDATPVEEGNALHYVVSLNGNTGTAVTANLGFGAGTTATGGATNNGTNDYQTTFYSDALLTTPISSVTLGGGNPTSIDVYVKTFDNDPPYSETNENVEVTLTSVANAINGNTTADGTITDGTPQPATVNDATVILSKDSSTEPGDESGDEGEEGSEGEEGAEGEDGGEEGGPADSGPAEGDEVTQEEAAEIEAEVEALVRETDLSETAESPAAGKPDSQQPQTRAEEVAQIMSIMSKAATLVSCSRDLPNGPL